VDHHNALSDEKKKTKGMAGMGHRVDPLCYAGILGCKTCRLESRGLSNYSHRVNSIDDIGTIIPRNELLVLAFAACGSYSGTFIITLSDR
jgi:hypothetical protein